MGGVVAKKYIGNANLEKENGQYLLQVSSLSIYFELKILIPRIFGGNTNYVIIEGFSTFEKDANKINSP